MITRILYTAEATVEGGREGHARTADGRLDLKLDVPAEMGVRSAPIRGRRAATSRFGSPSRARRSKPRQRSQPTTIPGSVSRNQMKLERNRT
jgi:hypothetical protein